MKRQMQWLWALVAAIAPVLASAQTVQRPIEDFVSTQGTYCLPNGSGGCFYFVPPVANFIGWGSQAHFGQFASIDYAGLANRYIETASSGSISFGTTFGGTITERPLPDGTARVTITLRTENALMWAATDPNYDFAAGQLIFGRRVTDVLAGAQPVLGTVVFHISFINSSPGAPLPDLIDLFFNHPQDIINYSFHATARYGEQTLLVEQTGNVPARSNIQAALVEVR
jgi:hypothetical protein